MLRKPETGFGLDWVRSWKVIGFPGALPPFSDLHIVTDNDCRKSDLNVHISDGLGRTPACCAPLTVPRSMPSPLAS